MDIQLSNVYRTVADEFGINPKKIKMIYTSYIKYIIKCASECNIDENTDIENVDASFNIPSVGKLRCNKRRFERKLKQIEHVNRSKESKANVHKADNNSE